MFLDIFNSHMRHGFLNTIPVQLNSISVLLLSHLSVLPALVHFLFKFEFDWEILVHPCRPPAAIISFCVHSDVQSLELGGCDP